MEFAAVRDEVRAALDVCQYHLEEWIDEEREKGRHLTFALAMLPMPRYTRLSRRCTSVRIVLSSSRFSSVRSVSMRVSAGLYCWDSS